MTDDILQNIVDFCQKKLEISYEAKSYLAKRNIDSSSIRTFEIGFCPVNMEDLFTKVDPVHLREIGFIKDASFSWFTNRIIFSVRDQYNKLVAIAGRILPQFFTGKRKYFNTFYLKSRVLYGLNQAIPFIRKTKEALVSEGHIDKITAFRYGINNLVSTCGTAFSFEHAMLLSRYAKVIKVIYDSDNAGITATEKILGKGYQGIEIQPVFLDKDEDVDSYLNKYGREKFLEKVKGESIKDKIYDCFK